MRIARVKRKVTRFASGAFNWAARLAFYGWMPLILVIGMREHPRPRLMDLVTMI